jgi:hypothetical protein
VRPHDVVIDGEEVVAELFGPHDRARIVPGLARYRQLEIQTPKFMGR